MKTFMIIVCLSLLLPCWVATNVQAQAGVSSLSMGASRAGIQLRFDDIRVEEFINYHRHRLPLPTENAVQLDARWMEASSDTSIFQVGLATPRAMNRELALPLNLVLVIDRSGSMSGDRIANVKSSILAFVDRLRDKDSVAIVSYSNTARVDLPVCGKSDTHQISRAVKKLNADGSTNLHAGLMLGYQVASKNFDSSKTNRVILLTDGIANEGVVDSKTIAMESSRYNKEGIDLSVIGLGQDFNHDLLRELSDVGRGLLHFVNDCKDIQKTFVREIDSLLSPAARKVKLMIDIGENETPCVYGYRPVIKNNQMIFKLDDLNCGATQVILGEIQSARRCPIRIELKYVDAVSKQPVMLSTQLEFGKPQKADSERDDLAKNYAIARVADAIKVGARFCENDEYRKARKKLCSAIEYARSQFEKSCDSDVDRVVKIAQRRADELSAAIKSHKVAKSDEKHRKPDRG